MRHLFFKLIATVAYLVAATPMSVAQDGAGNLYPGVIGYSVAAAGAMLVGVPAHGLAAALAGSPSVIHPGQTIQLSLEVRNVSKQMRWLYIPNMPCSYSFSVTDLHSLRPVEVVPSNCGDIYGSQIEGLSPGESAYLKFKFTEEAVAQPGRYEIHLASMWWYPKPDALPETLRIVSTSFNVTVSQ
jgi:hypothetical protein